MKPERIPATLVGVGETSGTLTFAVDPETFHRPMPVHVWIEARSVADATDVAAETFPAADTALRAYLAHEGRK